MYYHRKSIDKGTNDHKQNFVTVTHNLTTNIQIHAKWYESFSVKYSSLGVLNAREILRSRLHPAWEQELLQTWKLFHDKLSQFHHHLLMQIMDRLDGIWLGELLSYDV